MDAPQAPPVRWKRTFWAVWTTNLVTAVGMQSFLPFFPGHLVELGVTDDAARAVWSGVLYGAAPFSAALLAPVWGAVGDRIGRKLMVLRAMLAIAVFVGLMAVARTPLQVLGLRLLQGVFSGFVAPSMTLVSIAAPPERQGRVAGSLQAALAAGSIVGPLAGALVRSSFGVRAVYVWVAAMAALSALLVLLLAHEDPGTRRERTGASPSGRGLLGALRRDLQVLFESRALRGAVALLFWVQFGMGATHPVLELFVESLWEGDPALAPTLTGVAFSAVAVVNLLAVRSWGRLGDRAGHARTLHRSALASGAALGLHALVPGVAALVVARGVLGAATAGSGPCAFGVAAAETPTDRRGGAFGVVFSARALAVALSAMIGGYASTLLGLRGLFLAASAVVLTAAWVLRDLPRAASPPLEEEPAPAETDPRFSTITGGPCEADPKG